MQDSPGARQVRVGDPWQQLWMWAEQSRSSSAKSLSQIHRGTEREGGVKSWAPADGQSGGRWS